MHSDSECEFLTASQFFQGTSDQLTNTTTVVVPDRHGRHWVFLIWLGPAAGVLALAFADAAGRVANQSADLLYWVGLCLIYIPAIARVLSGVRIARGEAVSMVLTVACSFSLVRILQYPTGFALNDEFQQGRTLQDILLSGHLFSANPILPVSPAFPGLEILTDALIRLTGLPVFPAAMFTIVLAKQILTLALFLTFERVGKSTRLAASATLIYLACPSTLYDDGQYAYEILGLALAVTSLYLLVCATGSSGIRRAQYVGLAVSTMSALVVTHHVSAVLFVAFIALWAIIEPRFNNGLNSWHVPVIALVIMLFMLVGWYRVVAGGVAWQYLAAYPVTAFSGIIDMIRWGAPARTLFASYGPVVPKWEQLASYASVGITSATLVVGCVVSVVRYQLSGFVRALTLGGMVYFAALGLHLVPGGGETGSTRLMSWSLNPAAFVIALTIIEFVPFSEQRALPSTTIQRWISSHQRSVRALRLTMVVAFGIMFLGNVSIEAGFPWRHTPGPYMVGADARSISQQSIMSATWMQHTVGSGNRVATDTENSLLFASYGDQYPLTSSAGTHDPSVIFVNRVYDAQVQQVVMAQHIRYVIVDLHTIGALPPQVFFYLDPSKLDNLTYRTPLSRRALLKLDNVVEMDLIYDSGNMLIYKVR